MDSTNFDVILTRYNGTSSKVSAHNWQGRVSVPYDHALTRRENHQAAAQALADKFGKTNVLRGGEMPGKGAYVYAFLIAPNSVPDCPADCLCSRCTGAIGGN